MNELSSEQIQRLAEDVKSKIIAKEQLIAQSQGEITIRVFRRGSGFEIKLSVMT